MVEVESELEGASLLPDREREQMKAGGLHDENSKHAPP